MVPDTYRPRVYGNRIVQRTVRYVPKLKSTMLTQERKAQQSALKEELLLKWQDCPRQLPPHEAVVNTKAVIQEGTGLWNPTPEDAWYFLDFGVKLTKENRDEVLTKYRNLCQARTQSSQADRQNRGRSRIAPKFSSGGYRSPPNLIQIMNNVDWPDGIVARDLVPERDYQGSIPGSEMSNIGDPKTLTSVDGDTNQAKQVEEAAVTDSAYDYIAEAMEQMYGSQSFEDDLPWGYDPVEDKTVEQMEAESIAFPRGPTISRVLSSYVQAPIGDHRPDLREAEESNQSTTQSAVTTEPVIWVRPDGRAFHSLIDNDEQMRTYVADVISKLNHGTAPGGDPEIVVLTGADGESRRLDLRLGSSLAWLHQQIEAYANGDETYGLFTLHKLKAGAEIAQGLLQEAIADRVIEGTWSRSDSANDSVVPDKSLLQRWSDHQKRCWRRFLATRTTDKDGFKKFAQRERVHPARANFKEYVKAEKRILSFWNSPIGQTVSTARRVEAYEPRRMACQEQAMQAVEQWYRYSRFVRRQLMWEKFYAHWIGWVVKHHSACTQVINNEMDLFVEELNPSKQLVEWYRTELTAKVREGKTFTRALKRQLFKVRSLAWFSALLSRISPEKTAPDWPYKERHEAEVDTPEGKIESPPEGEVNAGIVITETPYVPGEPQPKGRWARFKAWSKEFFEGPHPKLPPTVKHRMAPALPKPPGKGAGAIRQEIAKVQHHINQAQLEQVGARSRELAEAVLAGEHLSFDVTDSGLIVPADPEQVLHSIEQLAQAARYHPGTHFNKSMAKVYRRVAGQ